MLTAESAFSLFLMLALASGVYWIARKGKLPYTVLLTLLGVLLVPLSALAPFAFFREFQLTPELLFFIFLPTLLFESAYNMPIRRLVDEFKPVMLLAIAGYIISSFLIGGGLWFLLKLSGFEVPFLVTLLFGTLISATDPVAVLALFKEYGAPRRLTLLFEGESLANDATALALFLIVLGLFDAGITTAGLALGAVSFVAMLIGGALVGLLMGALFVKLIQLFRDTEMVAITLMIVLAHLTFLVAELGGHFTAHIGLDALKFSPIIATTVASLFLGNYGRFKISPRAEEFVDKFWAQFAFMANSIVFILVGLLFASVPHGAYSLGIPIVLALLVVMAARAVSIYGTLIPFNFLSPKNRRVPIAWQHLLAWGSLRGALAVMLVLLIPSDIAVPGWTLDIGVRDFLLVITVGCIFFTLFIKAPTIGPLMRKLKIDTLSEDENAAEREAHAILHAKTILKLNEYSDKGYISEGVAGAMGERATESLKEAYPSKEKSPSERSASERVLKQYVIGLEKEALKGLLSFDEITEHVFKRIHGKLTLQGEAIEAGHEPDPHQTRDHRDVFENLAELLRGTVMTKDPGKQAGEDLLYYRAQEILARKVLKEVGVFEREYAGVVAPDILVRLVKAYTEYRDDAREKANAIRKSFPEITHDIDKRLAGRSIFRAKEKEINKLHHRGLLTPKLYIALRNESEETGRF